jgi:hypothetical protein
MKNRWLIHLIWTAIASPVFLFLSVLLNNTRFSGLYEALIIPGVTLTTWLGGMDGHMPDFALLFLCEIACYWMLLFACTTMIEFLLNRKSKQA